MPPWPTPSTSARSWRPTAACASWWRKPCAVGRPLDRPERDPSATHEASLLNLVIDKAHHRLGWAPRWDFATTVARTVGWYRQVAQGQASALACCLADLEAYTSPAP